MIDPIARAKLAQKQLRDDITKEIRNNVPQIPQFDTEPLKDSLIDTNKIGEDQLNLSTLNFETLRNIEESLSEIKDALKSLEPKPEATTGEKEIITQLKALQEILYPTEE